MLRRHFPIHRLPATIVVAAGLLFALSACGRRQPATESAIATQTLLLTNPAEPQ